jgi:hypothetical protein
MFSSCLEVNCNADLLDFSGAQNSNRLTMRDGFMMCSRGIAA